MVLVKFIAVVWASGRFLETGLSVNTKGVVLKNKCWCAVVCFPAFCGCEHFDILSFFPQKNLKSVFMSNLRKFSYFPTVFPKVFFSRVLNSRSV